MRMMRKRPYESIKVTDIVREAGVSRMTYYRYFKAKSDVLTCLIDTLSKASIPSVTRTVATGIGTVSG